MYISVIMSTYNEPLDWVSKSIDSILNQTYGFFEFIIVVDNPNYTELHKLISIYQNRDQRIVVIRNEENLGLVESLNKALNSCRYEYIARMDADDIAEPSRFESQLEYLMDNQLDLVGGGISIIDEHDCVIKEFLSIPHESNMVSKLLYFKSIVYHPTWIVKKSVYDQLGGYRNIHAAEDYDLLLRANLKNIRIGNLNKEVLRYRVRSESISNTNGFKQFLTSEFIKQKSRKGLIASTDELDKYLCSEMKEENRRKFDKSMNFLNEAIKYKSSGNSMFMLKKIFKSLLSSKYGWMYLDDRFKFIIYEKFMNLRK